MYSIIYAGGNQTQAVDGKQSSFEVACQPFMLSKNGDDSIVNIRLIQLSLFSAMKELWKHIYTVSFWVSVNQIEEKTTRWMT